MILDKKINIFDIGYILNPPFLEGLTIYENIK